MWTLKFISGKYQGGEFPLRPNREIIIGRSSDLDMVLVEDMVSRKHAKISTDDHSVSIQDLRLDQRNLRQRRKSPCHPSQGRRPHFGRDFDHQVGHGQQRSPSALVVPNRERGALAHAGHRNRRPEPKMMQGNIEEIPLPDLLQLLSTSRKSGVLVLRSEWGTGRLYLRKGQIYFANVDESFDVSPRKAMFRMLSGTRGCSSWSHPTTAR